MYFFSPFEHFYAVRMRIMKTDFQLLFESLPGAYVVVAPDSNYTIITASIAFLHQTKTERPKILGRSIFDIRPAKREDLRASLDRVERNSKIQLSLVDDLLDMSRLITGRMNLNIQQVDLAAIIEEVVESLRIAAEAKQLGIALELERTAGPVFGDANRLRQIVLNLLSNAIKFTDPKGEVYVTLRRVESHVELMVSDTGQGILPEFLPHIFERFRADHS